jgi:hypothetical protein
MQKIKCIEMTLWKYNKKMYLQKNLNIFQNGIRTVGLFGCLFKGHIENLCDSKKDTRLLAVLFLDKGVLMHDPFII